MSNSVHFANNLDSDIYVMVAPNQDWVWADLSTDLAFLAVDGIGAVNAVKDVWTAIKTVQALGDGIGSALKFTEFFKKNGITIKSGQCKDVLSKTTYENPLNYLTPSFWGALFGASDVTIIAVTDELKMSVMYNTNSDYSWIATGESVVRAKYGSLWQQSPQSGIHYFHTDAQPLLKEFTQYDDGQTPSVAIDSSNRVIEVHQSQNHSTLWCRMGALEGKEVSWGDSHQYDTGVSPSVTMAPNNKVVEVHQSENHNTLWYRVGTLSGDAIVWGASHQFDDGVTPSVTMGPDNQVIEVHKSQNHDTLWYRVGVLDGDEIHWGDSHQYDSGILPSVAFDGDKTVVEVHQSENHDTLWCRVGMLSDGLIEWGESHCYDNGITPSVAINRNGGIFEVHQSENNSSLWQLCGVIKNSAIEWSNNLNYTKGREPSIAMNNDNELVEVHKSQNHDTLWDGTGLYTK
ncbi:hypothetical protein MD588_10580 [Photobacterium sp. SDRW27]|uniref:hypothetical protein n=1 Tax=Photobacterium obscurum TaxID=2829490 RepID=UPI002244606D|nr:hypothetical protein [Photobacterium obscurum]MCW8329251.1 hypothetical protein [Photobacterium obscurum]